MKTLLDSNVSAFVAIDNRVARKRSVFPEKSFGKYFNTKYDRRQQINNRLEGCMHVIVFL